jgi:ferritin
VADCASQAASYLRQKASDFVTHAQEYLNNWQNDSGEETVEASEYAQKKAGQLKEKAAEQVNRGEEEEKVMEKLKNLN